MGVLLMLQSGCAAASCCWLACPYGQATLAPETAVRSSVAVLCRVVYKRQSKAQFLTILNIISVIWQPHLMLPRYQLHLQNGCC